MKIYQVEEYVDERYNDYSVIVGTFLSIENAKKFKEKMEEKYLVSGLVSGNCRFCKSTVDRWYNTKEDAEKSANLLVGKCALADITIESLSYESDIIEYYLDCDNVDSVHFLDYRIVEHEVLDVD